MQIQERRRWDKVIIASFLAVPILASIISTLHIIHFLDIGNPGWMSIFLSITFEVGSVASFLALSVLDKIKKGMVMFIFTILFVMQMTGNVYFSFEYVNIQLAINPKWMNTFIELVTPLFTFESQSTYKFVLALLIGLPVPIVSLAFLKSLVDYLKVDDASALATIDKIEGNHSSLSTVTNTETSQKSKEITPDTEVSSNVQINDLNEVNTLQEDPQVKVNIDAGQDDPAYFQTHQN